MHFKFTIRYGLEEEREALEALQWRASLTSPGDRDFLLAHPDVIQLPLEQIRARHVLVAKRNGVPIGFAAVLPRNDGDLELDGLFVEPKLWKSGVGRALVERCSRLARQMGATALHVVGNPDARGFYEACGFELVGVKSTGFPRGLLMRRELSRRRPPLSRS